MYDMNGSFADPALFRSHEVLHQPMNGVVALPGSDSDIAAKRHAACDECSPYQQDRPIAPY